MTQLSSHEVAATTVMICLLFGTNFIFYIFFQMIKISSNPHSFLIGLGLISSPSSSSLAHNDNLNTSSATSVDHHDKKDKIVPKVVEKELSKPFDGTLESFHILTTELFKLSLILLLTYICEYHWIFAHSGKEYSRDLFFFVLIIFFGYAWYTIKPNHDLTLLSREQTEEWKGWMQFIFLLYHYFHAEEVYNSVRVMITCYVWMTGFGNFSFFYMKQDFGWLRVVQMLWRLNFSVLLLMWTHGNTYILYYICPMHTFYFFMVYFTMYVYSSVNHSEWAIRVKLMVLGLLIYIIWDVNGGIFDILFSFLGTASVIGAKSGSVYEYYFRTSLDHYSAFLGMIFAVNFPLAEQYFHKAKGWPLLIASVIMGIIAIYWYTDIYSLPKIEYNLTHSYTAIIPLTAYIFFRNITPYIRSGVSMSLHDLGKTTLETYLLQHHIWLTSNAKTLLTIVPGHPWINFAFATVLFFVVSKELYRLTMSLRGMLMPDDKQMTLTNSVVITILLAVTYALATVLHTFSQVSLLSIAVTCLTLFLAGLLIVSRFCRQMMDLVQVQHWCMRMSVVSGLLLVVCMVALLFSTGTTTGAGTASLAAGAGVGSSGSNSPVAAVEAINLKTYATTGPSLVCQQSVMKGQWSVSPCTAAKASATGAASATAATKAAVARVTTGVETAEAYCGMSQWKWLPTDPTPATTATTNTATTNTATATSGTKCPPRAKIISSKARMVYRNKTILFIGDSSVRNVYHQFNTLLDPLKYTLNSSVASSSPFNSMATTQVVTTGNSMSVEALKHSNLQYVVADSGTTTTTTTAGSAAGTKGTTAGSAAAAGAGVKNIITTTQFIWAPFAENITTYFNNKIHKNELTVIGCGLWDALHIQNMTHYIHNMNKLISTATLEQNIKTTNIFMFLQPVKVQNNKLRSDDKQTFMTEEVVEKYREILHKSNKVSHYFADKGIILNPLSACSGRESGSADGIHYSEEVYQVVVQMIVNAYTMRLPGWYATSAATGKKDAAGKKPYVPRITGSMSFPVYGALLLALASVMCFTMDNWLGVGYLSLVLCGRNYDWEAAYGPMLKKLFRNSNNTANNSSSSNTGGNSAATTGGGAGKGGKSEANNAGDKESDSFLEFDASTGTPATSSTTAV